MAAAISYEVVVIYHFMALMKAYLGGFRGAARRLQAQPPLRFLRCLCVLHPSKCVGRSTSETCDRTALAHICAAALAVCEPSVETC